MSAAAIKQLRSMTGAGILDCKKALTENDNDVDKAVDWLRAKGIAKAAKKASRAATEGLVHSYVHAGGRIGVLLEVNCETDFVAMNEGFQSLVHDIAMHIAAAGPEFVSKDDVDDAAAQRKPKHIAERIVEGRMGKWFEDVCLLEQKFIKDDSVTVGDMITAAVARIGENIRVRRFARFVVGEGLAKKDDDFAAEVSAMAGQ